MRCLGSQLKIFALKQMSKYRGFRVKNRNITIISNNCWGGFMYQRYNIPFNSPFIGLFLFAPDYIKLLKDFKNLINKDLKFIEFSKSKYYDEIKLNNHIYPIALLGKDIEIHFLHYDSIEEANIKWRRRCKRINWDNIIFKFCDRDGCTESHIDEFLSIEFKHKICFVADSKYSKKGSDIIYFDICRSQSCVFDEWVFSPLYFDFVNYVNNMIK